MTWFVHFIHLVSGCKHALLLYRWHVLFYKLQWVNIIKVEKHRYTFAGATTLDKQNEFPSVIIVLSLHRNIDICLKQASSKTDCELLFAIIQISCISVVTCQSSHKLPTLLSTSSPHRTYLVKWGHLFCSLWSVLLDKNWSIHKLSSYEYLWARPGMCNGDVS